jgi:formylglycine-generating enzyme required for sulfatase activity
VIKEEVKGVSTEFQHTVEITKPFYMGIYTVTQAQYRQVMGANPSSFSAQGDASKAVAGMNTDDFPVETVSWDDAMAFCAKVSERPAVKGKGRVDLPTEAQWEYACRAGTTTVFHYGNSLSSAQANFDGRSRDGGAAKGVFLERTKKVGSYLPNAWGLFDMHGNVYQWCKDWYNKDYYHNCPRTDPCNETKADKRVLRGGSWSFSAGYCRSASRLWGAPGLRGRLVGFRFVLCLD